MEETVIATLTLSTCEAVKKVCTACKEEFPNTTQYFWKHSGLRGRKSLKPQCITCSREAANLKNAKSESTVEGRASRLRKSYRKIDKDRGMANDLTVDYMIGIITSECTYCGDTERLGVDRLDNTLGHTIDNTVACCPSCNIARNVYFTHDEMLVIGRTIREVKQNRIKQAA